MILVAVRSSRWGCGMKVLLDEPRVFVTYGSASVFCGDDPFETDYEPDDVYAGQENGICGAAVPGILQLTVGTHTGWVPFRVEMHAGAPEIDDDWAEVVEVSFRPTRKGVHLLGLGGDTPHRLALPRGDYRVRYSVRGIDEAEHDEETPDAYLLQFWPASPGPDRILRRTSPRAAYWHQANRGRPLPPAEQDAEEQALADEEQRYLRKKYGTIPNARLRAADAYTASMVLTDRPLLLAMSEVDDDVLREVARWSALQALTVAGIIDLPEIEAAVAALRTGQPLPAPFDDEVGWYSIAGAVTHLTYVPYLPAFDPEPDAEEPVQQLQALSALGSAAITDPLAAAASAVDQAATAFGPSHYLRFLADLRAAFPMLQAATDS
jgi:hypothetical protein